MKKSIHERAGELARLGIGRENRREVGMRRVWDLIHNLRDDTPDSGEADATCEERLDGDFVRGIQHRRAGTAQRSGFDGEIQRGESLPPRCLEFQPPERREVERVQRLGARAGGDGVAAF